MRNVTFNAAETASRRINYPDGETVITLSEQAGDNWMLVVSTKRGGRESVTYLPMTEFSVVVLRDMLVDFPIAGPDEVGLAT